MTTKIVLQSSLIADADFSAKYGFGLKLSATTADTASLAGAGGASFIGVCQNKPKLGEHAAALEIGHCPVSAGAAFSKGDDLTTDANGQFITASSGNHIVAEALEAASGANVLVEAFVAPRGIKP